MTLNEINAYINSHIFDYIPDCEEEHGLIYEAMKYSLGSGGKRIRPMLAMAFCRLCGADEKKAFPFACALEYIHTYSLIHDDLPCMDNDDMRRGQPSSHIKYGEANALLTGDALLTAAFDVAARGEIPPMLRLCGISYLSRNAGVPGMIGGQYKDLLNEERETDLIKLIETENMKTGALIKCACGLGCIAADSSPEQMQKAEEYGENLGMAFQIVDDILDVTSTSEQLGKPVGSDEKNGKNTYVSLLGLAEAEAAAKRYTDAALAALEIFGDGASELAGFTKTLLTRKK